MKNIRGKIIVASLCLCMSMWAMMPCFVFGEGEIGNSSVSGTKTGPEKVKPGETITYTITATVPDDDDGELLPMANGEAGDTITAAIVDGEGLIPYFSIEDLLPTNLEYVSHSVSLTSNAGHNMDSAFSRDGNNITLSVIHKDEGYYICPGETVELTVNAKVADAAPIGSKITNIAEFKDANGVLDSASTTATVVAGDDENGQNPDGNEDVEADSDDGTGAEPGSDDSPDTGDDAYLGLFFILMMLSVAGVLVTYKVRR
ncbi:MAG: isopeptide-forming domain-containing fimbrial protein [Eubacteriales bacterium]|nr:isopeptide-forming domain-containing fimbrial protein [Eubacteriales bacterium]